MPKAPKKLPEIHDENVVREEQSKGKVRPDGPGDETAPVDPTPRRAKPPAAPERTTRRSR